jgi:hypothetical protein
MINAMGQTIQKAKKMDRLCYLYQRQDGSFYTSFECRKGWLFRAYPGGRKELSTSGNEILKEAGIKTHGRQRGGDVV